VQDFLSASRDVDASDENISPRSLFSFLSALLCLLSSKERSSASRSTGDIYPVYRTSDVCKGVDNGESDEKMSWTANDASKFGERISDGVGIS